MTAQLNNFVVIKLYYNPYNSHFYDGKDISIDTTGNLMVSVGCTSKKEKRTPFK